MKRLYVIFLALFVSIAVAVPATYAYDAELAKKFDSVLSKGMSEGHWQVKADELNGWIKAKKKDFIVVDVRPSIKMYKSGHIPGAIYIPYNEMLKPANLDKLPKDKKIVIYCVTGQTQNLPVVPLRLLGYDARVMSFGYAAWGRGYFGGKIMKKAILNTTSKNFPVER